MSKRIATLFIGILILSTVFSPLGQAQEDVGKKVVSITNGLIGVPYRAGGTTLSGFDCSGFTVYVFNQVGIDLPRTASQQFNTGSSVSKADLQDGDLVFFATTSSSVSHVGIYIGNNQFVSATTSRGVKIDSINDPYYWGSRYIGAKRIIKETPFTVNLAPGEYVDVPLSNWAYPSISSLSKAGVIKGYDNGYFLPQKSITRAEAAKMLSETFTLEVTQASEVAFTYQDVPEKHWAYDYVAAATAHNLFNGYDGNIFKPDEPITRAEVAALLSRAFELQQGDLVIAFNDLHENHWAYSSIQALASNQIIKGYEDQTFRPSNQTTRAEFSYMLYNAQNQ